MGLSPSKPWPGPPSQEADLSAADWQLRIERPADIEAALDRLKDRQVDVFLEIGPQMLAQSISRCRVQSKSRPRIVATLGGAGQRQHPALKALGALYVAGVDLAWKSFFPADARCIRVPTYPWQRQSLWVQGTTGLAPPAAAPADRPIGSGSANGDGPTGDQAVAGQLPPGPRLSPRPDMVTPYLAPQSRLEEEIAAAWSEILGIDRVGVQDNFFELGGDSLQAVRLLNRLQAHLGEAIPGSVLFQIQTVDAWATHLRCQYAAAVRRLYPDEEVDGLDASEAGRLPAATGAIRRRARSSDADQLLASLDRLSEDQVDSLLGRILVDGETHE